MTKNPVLADIRQDREFLVEQLQTLEGGKLRMGPPKAHAERLIWLRGQIVALDVVIGKLEGTESKEF